MLVFSYCDSSEIPSEYRKGEITFHRSGHTSQWQHKRVCALWHHRIIIGPQRSLVAQFLAYEYHDMSAGWMAHTLDGHIIADTVRGLAVMANTVLCTGRVKVEPCHVRRSCQAACTLDGGIHIPAHLVQSYNEYNMLRSPGDGSHAVAVAVYVYNHSILTDGIDTGKIIVALKGLSVDNKFLFLRPGFIAVIDLIVASLEHRRYPRGADSIGAAPCDGVALGYYRCTLL